MNNTLMCRWGSELWWVRFAGEDNKTVIKCFGYQGHWHLYIRFLRVTLVKASQETFQDFLKCWFRVSERFWRQPDRDTTKDCLAWKDVRLKYAGRKGLKRWQVRQTSHPTNSAILLALFRVAVRQNFLFNLMGTLFKIT